MPPSDLRRFVTELCGPSVDVLSKSLVFAAGVDESGPINVRELPKETNEALTGYSRVLDPRNDLRKWVVSE